MKRYPQREVDILAEVLDSINKQRSAAIKNTSSSSGFNPNETIGLP